MSDILLNGDWDLTYFQTGKHDVHHPDDLEGLPVEPIGAIVPGNVELDLERAGILPDPFFGANIRELRPLETCEWWYSRSFDVPDEMDVACWDLVFEGLDTVATVWVNGEEVGRSENMLIEHRFDVSAALKPGAENRIDVRLASAMLHAREEVIDPACMSWEHRLEGVALRKAPHVWGWDIMPRAVSAGIWRGVRLEMRPIHTFDQLYYWTIDTNAHGATLGVRFQVRTDLPDVMGCSVRFHGVCGDHHFEYEWPIEFVADGCRISVPDAQLWWPKGYGEPNLYTVTAQFCRGDEVLAERIDLVGLRTVAVERTERAAAAVTLGPKEDGARYDEAPDPSAHFLFRVNGVPVMIKGANWVPLDAFHSRDAERVEQALALFDDLGCNMVRCWGGNVYEDHRFFDICDEKGMLVWQDFAFACCRYPQTEEFLARVRQEAEFIVAKLRNHPSLALWCGDNEIDLVYLSEGLRPEQNRITREVLPQVAHRCDPFRHYVASSPFVTGSDHFDAPEQHLWGPRNYYKSPFYTQHNANFIGEMGYHGCPNVSSIQKFISDESVWPWQDNEEWRIHDVSHLQHRTEDRDRIALMSNQIREVFGAVPEDLETYALASQIVQAEAKKFFVESTRLRKWRTSGVLWWNVIDGWPQFSDAIVDYFFGKKLACHYLWRAQRPVSAFIGEAGSEKYLPIIISNDTRQDAEVSYRVTTEDPQETLAEGHLTVPANENWQAGRLRTYASDQRLYLVFWDVNGETFGSHYLAGTPAFSLDQYREWLPAIAALPRAFDAGRVAR